MREISDTYKEILKRPHNTETSLSIDGADPANSVQENDLFFVETIRRIFSSESPSVGGCVSGEIKAEFFLPSSTIPRCAKVIPYVRIKTKDGTMVSEWFEKGVFYVDTRKIRTLNNGRRIITINGFDDMLRMEQDYPSSNLNWPAKDIDVVKEICNAVGINIDDRTLTVMSKGYKVPFPSGYTCREVLGYIAAMYAGNFVMSDIGELLLFQITGVPKIDRYLMNENEKIITLGGVAIIV